MGLLYLVTDFFINTFGITAPTDKTRDRAAWFIASLTALVLVGVALFGLFALHVVEHGTRGK